MLMPHETQSVVIPVRVDTASMLDSIRKAWSAGRALHFDADMKISPPISLTRSLLRRSASP